MFLRKILPEGVEIFGKTFGWTLQSVGEWSYLCTGKKKGIGNE